MIRLKNIKIDNSNTVICDIFPEDCKHSGHIEIDILQQKISNYSLPTDYEWCKNHMEHAKSYILKTLKENKSLPSEKTLIWC